MDYASLDMYRLMKAKMGYSNQRQVVLSQTLANIDTPGYKARDLRKVDFSNLADAAFHRLEMRTTSPMHVGGPRNGNPKFRMEDQRNTYETKPVENSVVLEEQMMKVATNQMDYQITTSAYRKMNDMFKIAISNR